MKLKAQIEIEMEVDDFYSPYDAVILCKNEISNQLKGMCTPESIKFVKNFVNAVADTNSEVSNENKKY